MRVHAGRLANYPQLRAGSMAVVDHWLTVLRESKAAADDPRVGALETADRLLACTTRETLAGALVAALERLDIAERAAANERQYAVRYLTAYRSARERAQNHLAALQDADEERDALRAALARREDEVAELVARLAEYQGLIR